MVHFYTRLYGDKSICNAAFIFRFYEDIPSLYHFVYMFKQQIRIKRAPKVQLHGRDQGGRKGSRRSKQIVSIHFLRLK